MGQHKVAKAIKEKHVIKFQKFDSPKSQKLTLIINGLRSLPRPYGMVLVFFVWADSTAVKKYCLCFSALYLGRRFGFLFVLLGQHLGYFP